MFPPHKTPKPILESKSLGLKDFRWPDRRVAVLAGSLPVDQLPILGNRHYLPIMQPPDPQSLTLLTR